MKKLKLSLFIIVGTTMMTFLLSSCSKSGVVTPKQPDPVPSAPVLTLSKNSDSIFYNRTVNIGWSSDKVITVNGVTGRSGEFVAGPFTSNQTIQVTGTYDKGSVTKQFDLYVLSQATSLFAELGWKQSYIKIQHSDSSWHDFPIDCNTERYYPDGGITRTYGSCHPEYGGAISTVNAKWGFQNNESQVNLTVNETAGTAHYIKYIRTLSNSELVWRFLVIGQGGAPNEIWEERYVH